MEVVPFLLLAGSLEKVIAAAGVVADEKISAQFSRELPRVR